MTKLTGAQAIVKSLIAHGVDTVFGLPGGQLDHLFDAMYLEQDRLRVIHSRHEQGVAYMAYGYAKSTGRVGTYAVVPGPGLLNSTAALCTAWANNAPVLCLSGQVPSYSLGKGYGDLHEINDQLGMIGHITKWAHRIEHPAHAPAAINEAMRQLRNGRPRPVEVEMCMDVMGQRCEVDLQPADSALPRPPIDDDLIEQAAKLLGAAKHPLIVIGSGALDAGQPLLELAEALQAPVMAKRNGKGVVDSDHYLSANIPAGHRHWGRADVVLAIGTRLRMPLLMWGMDEGMKLIRVDIDPVELTRICQPDVGIMGDADDVLRALLKALARHNSVRASRKDELMRQKRALQVEMLETVGPQMAYLGVIREELPADGIFVDEVTQVGFVSWYGFPVHKPRQHITAGYQGTLGYGFATALGVAVAHPDKQVLQISGDGGFLFNVQELATAVQYRIPLVTVIFNDRRFTNVQRQQIEWFEGRVMCSDLHNPDFVKLAESFGATGLRATDPESLRLALRQAFALRAPVIIEVKVDEFFPAPWKHIMLPQNRRRLLR